MHKEEMRVCFAPQEELRVIQAEGEPTRLRGLAVPYEKPSDDLGGFREIMKRGAFSESLRDDSDKRVDVEHDRRMLMGRTSKGTASFSEDERGVWVDVRIPKSARGEQVLDDVRSGNLDAMSVVFRVPPDGQKFRREKDGIYRDVSKATLRGVTLTAFPAYPQTAGELAARSLEEWRDDETKAAEEAEQLRGNELAQLRKRLDFAEAEEPPRIRRG